MDHETRRCPRCATDKSVTAFGVRAATGRPTAWCAACKKMYDRDWYRRNKPLHGAAVARRNARIRARNRRLLKRAKAVPCADCGVRYEAVVMDFDHVRGVKRANVSLLAGSGASEEAILAEIAKCDVVCANCHRERTHGSRAGALRGAPVVAMGSADAVQLRLVFEQGSCYQVAG